MRRAFFLLLAVMLLVPGMPGARDRVIGALDQNRIAITANFDGTEILVFGTIRRDRPMPVNAAPGIIVTIAGPPQKLTVRRKERWSGIWVNRDALEVDAAPSFYALATSEPLRGILSWTDDLRHSVSIPEAIRSVGVAHMVEDVSLFTDALIRIRTANNLYQDNDDTVDMLQRTLFNTSFELPSNLVEGIYTVRLLLTQERAVIDTYEAQIYVQKVGLERLLYNMAREQPLLYGILSLVLAIGAGWGASEAFRYIRS